MKENEILYKGFLIEIDDGEINLVNLLTLETLWLTELLHFGYSDKDMAIAVAKQWIDNVPTPFLMALCRGQSVRLAHEQHECEHDHGECADGSEKDKEVKAN